MTAKDITDALCRAPMVERTAEGRFRFSKGAEGAFYFGESAALSITKVTELTLLGDMLELVSAKERAFFPCAELVGFKVATPEGADAAGGSRAGFAAR